MVDELVSILDKISNCVNIFLFPIITLLLVIKIKNEKSETGKYNIIRSLICGCYACFSWLVIWEFIDENIPIGQTLHELIGNQSHTFGLFNVGYGIMVCLGLMMIVYANQKETLYYTPIFIFSGMVIFYLLTGFQEWLMIYIYTGSVLGLLFLYITGFRLKDNGSLGIAIMFSLAFSTIFLQNTLLASIISFGYIIFAIVFALGYFEPFKEQEVN